jgi:ABC-type molybdate transport system ATPase subunit
METMTIGEQGITPPTFKVGGHYQIEADPATGVDKLLAQLPAFPKTVRVDPDGGLMSHLSVAKNLSLPLEYHAQDIGHIAEDASLLFLLCGEDKAGLPRLMERYPDALSNYEKRLVGFVRALLLEPEVLVLDDVFDGLSNSDKDKALQWENIFRLRFPFRVLYIVRTPNNVG